MLVEPNMVSNFIWLVVLTILKNMKVNGKNYPIYIYIMEKKMFQTTNQLCCNGYHNYHKNVQIQRFKYLVTNRDD